MYKQQPSPIGIALYCTHLYPSPLLLHCTLNIALSDLLLQGGNEYYLMVLDVCFFLVGRIWGWEKQVYSEPSRTLQLKETCWSPL